MAVLEQVMGIFGPYPEDLLGIGVNSNDEIFVYSGVIFKVINNYSEILRHIKLQKIHVV